MWEQRCILTTANHFGKSKHMKPSIPDCGKNDLVTVPSFTAVEKRATSLWLLFSSTKRSEWGQRNNGYRITGCHEAHVACLSGIVSLPYALTLAHRRQRLADVHPCQEASSYPFSAAIKWQDESEGEANTPVGSLGHYRECQHTGSGNPRGDESKVSK